MQIAEKSYYYGYFVRIEFHEIIKFSCNTTLAGLSLLAFIHHRLTTRKIYKNNGL